MALLIAAVLYACFFSGLGAVGLLGPDEPRYAAVAREMAESGDWVTPRLHGQPWFEKPVLYYWGAALAFRVWGVNEFAARLPSTLAAFLASLALGWAAWRSWGTPALRMVLLLFPTCVAALGFARAATPDMLFSASLTLAMVTASPLIWSRSAGRQAQPLSRGALCLFAIFLGAATLAKGPAAIVLAGGSVGLWALLTRRWREAFRLLHPLAIACFCVTALPWYLLCAERNPGFVRVFLLQHNIERYLTPVFRHVQPFWFFAPVLLVGLLPWTLLLIAVARDALRAWREKRWNNSPEFFYACWAIFPVVFFSLSESKLPGYVLPAVPPLVLLLARSVARLAQEKSSWARPLFAGIGIAFVALGASAAYWLKQIQPASRFMAPPWAVAVVALACAGGLIAALVGWLQKPVAALVLCGLLTAGLIEAATLRLLPQLDAHLSPRLAARAARAHPGAAQSAAVYRVRRAWHYGLNFYLRRELPEWTPAAQRPAWVYTNAAGLAELQREGAKVSVADPGSPPALLVRIEP